MVYTIKINSIEEIQEAAKEFLSRIKDGGHRIFAFYGELGAGKTTFIKALCKELKVQDITSSPSFSLINEYYSVENGVIYHFDFYRLEQIEEAFDLGYEDYFFSGNYCFIEWPEKIIPILPDHTSHVYINRLDDERRVIEVTS